MSTLYELTTEYLQLLELAEDPETDPEVLADTMEAIGGELEDKAQGYACVIRQMEYDVAAIDAEVKRLVNRKKAAYDNIDRMKAALQAAMVATGKRKFKTALFSFNVQKNPPSVIIDEPMVENIPDAYLIYQEPKINKKALMAELKAGHELPGLAHLEQDESLRIR